MSWKTYMSATIEPTFMIIPCFRRAMRGMTAFAVRRAPNTFASKVRLACSVEMSTTGPMQIIPALLTHLRTELLAGIMMLRRPHVHIQSAFICYYFVDCFSHAFITGHVQRELSYVWMRKSIHLLHISCCCINDAPSSCKLFASTNVNECTLK